MYWIQPGREKGNQKGLVLSNSPSWNIHMTSPEALASPSSKSPTRERGQDRPPRVIFASWKRNRKQTVRRTLGKPLGPYPIHMYPLSGAIWPQQLTLHRLRKVTNLWTSKSWSSTPTCLDTARYLNKIEKTDIFSVQHQAYKSTKKWTIRANKSLQGSRGRKVRQTSALTSDDTRLHISNYLT